MSAAGRVARYSLRALVRPSYSLADLALPRGAFALPGSSVTVAGRVAPGELCVSSYVPWKFVRNAQARAPR